MGINYIICAAGAGTRFTGLGLNTPKPLLMLEGKTLLEWSVESLPIEAQDTLIIITGSNDTIRPRVAGCLQKNHPDITIKWIQLDQRTSGQLHTALLSKPHWTASQPIVIYNCDTYFESHSVAAAMQDPTIEGLIPCAKAKGEMWSFCQIEAGDRVTQVAEKKRISSWASVGYYYFRDAEKFAHRAQTELERPDRTTESYVAPLYESYLAAGEKVMMDRVSRFKPMGTPEQIAEFWGTTPETFAEYNRRNARP